MTPDGVTTAATTAATTDGTVVGGTPGPGAPGGASTWGGAPGRIIRTGWGHLALPALAAGVLLALSLPPWGWWPLAFGGAAVLYWRLAGLGWRRRLVAGWVAGLGCYVPGLWWAKSFNWYGAALLMAVEALAVALTAVLVPATRGRLPAFVGASTLLEAARTSWPFGGLPLGGIFLGQAGGPLLVAARLGGPLLLTLLVWAGGAAVAALVMDLSGRSPERRRLERRRRPWAGAVTAALVVALVAGASLAPGGGPAVGHLTVAAVQGGGRRGLSKAEVPVDDVFDAQMKATRRLVGQDGGQGPALVVWPEDVVSVVGSLAASPQATTLSSLARRLHTTLVVGVTVTVSPTHFRNEAVVWGPNGRVVGTYEKVHRVPFGEYVPYRSFFAHFASLSAVPLDAIPGHGTGMLRTPAARLGLMISYEVFFASRGRSAVGAGARLLVVPTNTSSYATSQVPGQEVAADRVQAVEEGRDVVQASPTGYSTVVAASGAVVRRSGLGDRQVLTATVALRTGTTLYQRFGDVSVLVVAALLLAAGLATGLGPGLAEAARRQRRRGRAAPAAGQRSAPS